MKRLFAVALAMAFAAPVGATTVASFEGSYTGSVSTEPGEELLFDNSGFIDNQLTSMLGAGIASLVLPGAVAMPTPRPLSGAGSGFIPGSVNASAETNGEGFATAVGAYVTVLNFENFGNTTEFVRLSLNYALGADSSTTSGPEVLSVFGAVGALDVTLDGTNVFNRTVQSDNGTPSSWEVDTFLFDFEVAPNQGPRQLRISVAGGAAVEEELTLAVVPLPAGGFLLLFGLVGLGLMRRTRRV